MWQIVLKKLSAAKLRELNIFAFADKNTLRKSKGILFGMHFVLRNDADRTAGRLITAGRCLLSSLVHFFSGKVVHCFNDIIQLFVIKIRSHRN